VPGASRELRLAFDYYKAIVPDLALRIVGAVEAKTDWLGMFPATGAPSARGLRKSLVADTPYLIIHRIRTTSIDILRIRHAAEDWRP